MTAEQLEELPADVAEVIRHLTRRVLAAEKLVNALENMISAYSEPDRQLCCDGQHCGCRGGTVRDEADWISCSALTAYREARK